MKTKHTHELIDEAIADAAYWKGQAKNAPELLANLKELVRYISAEFSSSHALVDRANEARAAIAKAEGVK